ncbi:MAG: radical SAM protein [Thermodesulfobacteriota bacterium]
MKTIIFKATDICNSNCIYCHAVRKNQSVKTMPLEILERFFERINAFLTERPEETLKIIWHGGEPLTLGPDYFYKALAFKDAHCRETGPRISFDMQSNLTLFSKEYVDVLQKMGIKNFGTSFELLPGVRGSGGKTGSDSYNRQFIRALSLLEEEGFSWGIIYVVTKLALNRPIELFRTLTNFVPSTSVMFNPVTFLKDKPGQVAITPEEFVDFLGEIFTEWWPKRERYPGVDPFKSLVDNLLGVSEALLCTDSGRCADTHLCVSPDGTAWQCGRSSDWDLMRHGSIVESPLADILNHPQREALRKRPAVLKEGDCSGCRFWGICHGGCPLDALAETGSILHKSPWCWTKKGFIEKYLEPATGITYRPAESPAQEPARASEDEKSLPRARPRPRMFPAAAGGSGEPPWIGPIPGMDDVLMVSGILQQIVEKNPSRRFKLVNKAGYRDILSGHPAIAEIGLPPRTIDPVPLDYGGNGAPSSCQERAYQVLAERLGLETPAAETLFVPFKFEDDPYLMKFIPWKARNIIICPNCETPRKQMNTLIWEKLSQKLIEAGFGVMQLAGMKSGHVRGVYSLQGLIHVRQVISVIRHFDLVITTHNLFMQIARLHKIPAVVLWGPTDHRFFGYQGHHHLQSRRTCPSPEGCIGRRAGHIPAAACPMGDSHCMNRFEVETIYQAAQEALNR